MATHVYRRPAIHIYYRKAGSRAGSTRAGKVAAAAGGLIYLNGSVEFNDGAGQLRQRPSDPNIRLYSVTCYFDGDHYEERDVGYRISDD